MPEPIEISDVEQGSDAWKKLRVGIPTASMFKTVLANGKGGGESLTRAIYLRKLVGEIITGEPMENYVSDDMARGSAIEEETRSYYAFTHNVEVKQVGFIRRGRTGCSPDGIVADDGLVEFKSSFPHILIDKLLRGTFPPEYKAQCQGELWICEREWIDLSIYWPKMPTFTIRAFREELYIAELSREVDRFNEELAETVERVKRYGQEG